MRKWLSKIIAIVILSLSLLNPIVALADTTAGITVTAVGYIVAAPGGFTVWYISDYEVGISWIKPLNAVNTMIRAKYGSAPTSITDGYQVYYGPDEITSDTGVSLDETATEVYYRAWSQTAGGIWGPLWAEGQMEGIGMTLIALILMAMAFIITSYIFKKSVLAFAAAGSFGLLGYYALTKSTATWDVYFSLFWLSMGLLIACMFAPLAYRETTPDSEETEEPDARELRIEMEEAHREQNIYSSVFRGRKRTNNQQLVHPMSEKNFNKVMRRQK